jgi:hypothetical protein
LLDLWFDKAHHPEPVERSSLTESPMSWATTKAKPSVILMNRFRNQIKTLSVVARFIEPYRKPNELGLLIQVNNYKSKSFSETKNILRQPVNFPESQEILAKDQKPRTLI